MPRIDLNLPGDIHAQLEAWADEQGTSKRSAAALIIAKFFAVDYQPPERGGWRGNEASLDNLVRRVDELTDGGRNDPAEDV